MRTYDEKTAEPRPCPCGRLVSDPDACLRYGVCLMDRHPQSKTPALNNGAWGQTLRRVGGGHLAVMMGLLWLLTFGLVQWAESPPNVDESAVPVVSDNA